MTKISGFLSQDVEVTRQETPDDPTVSVWADFDGQWSDPRAAWGSAGVTTTLPPEWLPLIEKILRFFDQLQYPIMGPFGHMGEKKAGSTRKQNTYITVIRAAWAILDVSLANWADTVYAWADPVAEWGRPANKALWKTAAAFVKRTNYQLFVKDYSYRLKNGLSLPGSPNVLHQTHGLLMGNWGGVGNVRLQRDDVDLTGQVTVSFNYKKVERAPTPSVPFKFLATLYYFEDGENKMETHTWNAPAGNVDWASVSETFGTANRLYYHLRVIFYLDSYDADVYFANFLIQDKTLTWTVDYDATVLPENASPIWTKTGSISTEKIWGDMLHLAETTLLTDSVVYSRVPVFDNSIGSSVKWRLKIEKGPDKDSGTDNYLARVVHCDGTRKAEYLFYQNGFILKLGNEYFKYHLGVRKYRTYKSHIRQNRLYFFIGRTLVFRKELATSGSQEVSFGHFGRSGHETESRWGFVRYFQGADEDPGFDVLREGWWLKAGEEWEPEVLYRNKGWSFLPGYYEPYFSVIYLT